jgi:hypothetical protein
LLGRRGLGGSFADANSVNNAGSASFIDTSASWSSVALGGLGGDGSGDFADVGGVVYMAPSLVVEALFDGALSYALSRHPRLRAIDWAESCPWLVTAVPLELTAVFVAGLGAAMAGYSPGARAIGEVTHARHLAAAATSRIRRADCQR